MQHPHPYHRQRSDDWEDVDPGLARRRTQLAWVRTAIAFAAVGGAVLKTNIAAGATVLALAPVIALTGRFSRHSAPGQARPGHLLLTTAAVTTVALVVLVVVLLGHGNSPGFRVHG
jgi:uncharacterized membrane protein YidH (DUF202 family)